MRKLYSLLIFFVLSIGTSSAQDFSNYYFSSKSGVALADMTGANIGILSNSDEESSPVLNLPFTFIFNGTHYSQFSISSNGYIALGTIQVKTDYFLETLPELEFFPVLAPWQEDLQTLNGAITYKTLGTIGSRKLVIQWHVASVEEGAQYANRTFQLWLTEGNNQIHFVYGNGSVDWYNDIYAGIAVSNQNVRTIDFANDALIEGSSKNYEVWPGPGKAYTFSPNTIVDEPEPIAPISISGSTVTNAVCLGGSTGAINIGSIAGGSGSYTIKWTGPNGYIRTGNLISNLFAGNYHYTVTDGTNASAATGSFTVQNGVALSISNTTIFPEYTVSPGGEKHTIYLGYGADNVSLSAGQVLGGSGFYSYTWTTQTGTSLPAASTITVKPTTTTTYNLTVNDNNGCSAKSTITVNVVDVRCGEEKVLVCHKPTSSKAICVSVSSVAALLEINGKLGVCPNTSSTTRIENFGTTDFFAADQEQKVRVYPNPSSGKFFINLTSNSLVVIVNTDGKIVYSKSAISNSGQPLELNLRHHPRGLYLMKIENQKGTQTIKLVVQ